MKTLRFLQIISCPISQENPSCCSGQAQTRHRRVNVQFKSLSYNIREEHGDRLRFKTQTHWAWKRLPVPKSDSDWCTLGTARYRNTVRWLFPGCPGIMGHSADASGHEWLCPGVHRGEPFTPQELPVTQSPPDCPCCPPRHRGIPRLQPPISPRAQPTRLGTPQPAGLALPTRLSILQGPGTP